MTTEIAIMNKTAIALAADSAVTVSNADKNLKTYNTANKVFALSKYAPVGIMIYGNADLTGVPWETIIKMFREYLSDQRKNKLEEYCDLFLEY
ncbi:MAG: hypothetical protein U5N56_03610 [Candidatus Marinimicrobia bacterium]|nr:hypothetical protein [Candidatus Neomarinimicrobiota bacterium]